MSVSPSAVSDDDFTSEKHEEFTPDEATTSVEPPPKRFDSPAGISYVDVPPRGSTTGQSTATTRVVKGHSSQGSSSLHQSNSALLQRLFTPSKPSNEAVMRERSDEQYFMDEPRGSFPSTLPEDDGLVIYNGKAVPYCEPPTVCVIVPGQRRNQMKSFIKEMEERMSDEKGDRLAAFKIDFPRQIDSEDGTVAQPTVENDLSLEEVDDFQVEDDRFQPFHPDSPLSIPATQAAVLLDSPRNHQRAVSVANSYAALGEESMEMQELRALREKAQRVIREFEGSISQSPTRMTRSSQGVRIAPSPPTFPPPNKNRPRQRSTYSKASHATSIAEAVDGLPMNFAYTRQEEMNRADDIELQKNESKIGEFQLNLNDINVALASSAAYSPHQSMQSPSLAKFEHQVSSMQSMIERLKSLPPPPAFTPNESPEHQYEYEGKRGEDYYYHDRHKSMSVDSLER